ncbi:helix-turn-helix domain-containing protein [Trichlorobacter lovleyi]|uniref:helix-turn-helix domain-containing protein n=1 Tax=Trichlorobacter lovleyi TaxID=313985 RepID=UPI00223F3D06|nr:helix-turn-helix transcriptional regulator [Trichlorobacter lovleyi]
MQIKNEKVVRLKLALKEIGEDGRGSYSKIAEMTGFSPAYVGQVLNGKKDNPSAVFLRATCNAFKISDEWVNNAKKPMLDHPEDFLYSKDGKIIGFPDPGFLGRSGYWLVKFPEKDPIKNILQMYTECGEAELGSFAGLIVSRILSLPDHDVIDLAMQLRKIVEGIPEKEVTSYADKFMKDAGIKPFTRLKLKRIPVEPEEKNRRNKEKE